MKVVLKHELGMIKTVKKGFSWTVFFFGFFVPLIRGDLKWALIMFLTQFLAASVTMGLGVWIASLIFAFFYNKLYIKDLLEKGYRPTAGYEEIVMHYVNG